MPQLGLGLGLNKGSYIKPLPKWLTDAGCTFAINVDGQVRQAVTPLSPRTLPNGVFNDQYYKRVSNDVVIQSANITAVSNLTNVTVANISNSVLTGMLSLSVSDAIATKLYSSYSTPLNGQSIDNLLSIGKHYFNPSVWNVVLPLGTTIEQARALLAGMVIRYQLATPVDIVNSPFINPLVDITKKGNNVTLQSFAGTTADGYTQIALPNGKNPWFLKFDGTDSLGIMANTADVDILGINDFAISTVFLTPATIQNGYIICKNTSLGDDQQYAILLQPTGVISLFLNGSNVNLNTPTPLSINTLYELIVVRINGILIAKINKAERYNQSNAANILTKPNLRIGARSSNADGTTHTTFTNINLGNLAIFYNGATGLDIAKVEKAVAKFNANYI